MADATKQAEHTPGPWSVEKHGGIPYQVWTEGGEHVDRTVATLNQDLEAEANARLIAAAPELLDACEKALYALEHVNERMGISEDEVDLPNTIRAAITKAKGDTDG